jgi:hypothetical protein
MAMARIDDFKLARDELLQSIDIMVIDDLRVLRTKKTLFLLFHGNKYLFP